MKTKLQISGKTATPFLLAVLLCVLIGYSSKGQTVLINDNFTTNSGNWLPVTISGTAGSFSISGGVLTATANRSSEYGVYNSTALSGHFYAEVNFSADNYVGLALIKKNGSTPDLNNYTMICVNTVASQSVISIQDKQNGTANALDNTHYAATSRYSHTLTGTTYSVPFTSTDKKIRIFRHQGEQFFHFFYSVRKTVDGVEKTDWIELAPSKEWGASGDQFYLALIARKGQAVFDNAYCMTKPLADQSDATTGFAATTREYNFSGYFGSALVITFGSQFPFAADGRKFVFPALNNYVPAWHYSNSLQYSYEFVETWGGGSSGCHEPMSDRLLRYSFVELVEDNAVRKVVHWHYALMDPDYKTPDDGLGTQIPEVEEIYTFYPDGTVVRTIRYTPKLDTSFRNWHELSELIVISGENTWPSEHIDNPALSIWDLSSTAQNFYPQGSTNYSNSSALGATALITHFKDNNFTAPDAFNAFSDDPAITSATYGGNQIDYAISWHSVDYAMCHWPVNKEPYFTDAFKNVSNWSQQVDHVGIAGIEVYGGTDWGSNYKTNATTGRKYREWVSLMGLNAKGSQTTVKDKTYAWLYPGTIVMNNALSTYTGYKHDSKLYTFSATQADPFTQFTLTPQYTITNAAFRCDNWGTTLNHVKVNGAVVSNYTYAIVGGSLLVWYNGIINAATQIEFWGTACTTPATPGAITGGTNVAVGSAQTYSVGAVSGATSYTWTLPSTWTGTSTTTSIAAIAGTVSGNVTVKANNACGASAASTLAVTVTSGIPATPGAISGSTSVAYNSSQVYSISAVNGATSYLWTLPPGWTGNSSGTSITTTVGNCNGNITVKAVNANGTSAASSLAVTVTGAPTTNIALSKTCTVSSQKSSTYAASKAVDNSTSTYWCSNSTDPSWIYVNLGARYAVNRINVLWKSSYIGKNYLVQISNDAINWTTLVTVTNNTTATCNYTGLSATGRYVRIYGTARNNTNGYGINELQVYGTTQTNIALNKTATATSVQGGFTYPASSAVDGNTTTRWGSEFYEPQSLTVDLGAAFNINGSVITWEACYATSYQVQTSPDNVNWTTIYSTTSGTGGTEVLNLSGYGRYIRLNCITRANTTYGFSVYEFEVYGNFQKSGMITTAIETTKTSKIVVFPNPAADLLNISLGNINSASLNIYRLDGSLIYTEKLQKNDAVIDVKRLNTSGLVILKISTETEIRTFKVILK